MTELNSDPLEHERVWYRHKDTGDRGYAVVRGGNPAIRFDRGMTVDQSSLEPGKWKLDTDKTPEFSAIQIAQICFEADKKLCWAMGLPELAKREWLDLSEKRRIAWVNKGPQVQDVGYARRARLYMAIQTELGAG